MPYRRMLTVLAVLLLTACGSGGKAAVTQTQSDADSLVEELGLSEKVTQIEDRIVQGQFSFAEGAVSESVVYMHKDSSSDVVAVFKATDVDSCRASITAYLKAQKKQMATYYPGEVFKIDNAVVDDNGSEVILIVCDDLEKAKTAAEKILK